MNDAPDRRRPEAIPRGQHAAHIICRSDVDRQYVDGDTAAFQFADGRDSMADLRIDARIVPLAPRRQRITTGQQDPLCPMVRKPGRHQKAQCAKASGDEVGRVGSTSKRIAYRLVGQW